LPAMAHADMTILMTQDGFFVDQMDVNQ
jgi:hypothetical protein